MHDKAYLEYKPIHGGILVNCLICFTQLARQAELLDAAGPENGPLYGRREGK